MSNNTSDDAEFQECRETEEEIAKDNPRDGIVAG